MNSPEYPSSSPERNDWIQARRPARNVLDPNRPYAFLLEKEPTETGAIASVATVFLTNRECPWRCLMCDLWRNTLTETVSEGAIPTQIEYALAQLPAATRIKLYNSGSFFDPNAIPVADYPEIAARLRTFEQVIVESHPALVDERCLRFRDLLSGKLEVAMGLETAHPEVLQKLNKQMSREQFARAAEFLRAHEITIRVFILVKPPFLSESEALKWAKRSIDFAFQSGASVVSLIPTRFGNGALETLAGQGAFSPPKLATLESAITFGLEQARGRIFADLWDLEKFCDCGHCFGARKERLHEMNLRQTVLPSVKCDRCEH